MCIINCQEEPAVKQAREQAEYTTGAFLAVVNNDEAKVRADRSTDTLAYMHLHNPIYLD